MFLLNESATTSRSQQYSTFHTVQSAIFEEEEAEEVEEEEAEAEAEEEEELPAFVILVNKNVTAVQAGKLKVSQALRPLIV